MSNNKQIRLLLARVQSLEDVNEALKAERDRLQPVVDAAINWTHDHDGDCKLANTLATYQALNHKEDRMLKLVKRIKDDDGVLCLDNYWHIMDANTTIDCERVLCTGEAYDGCSDLELDHKTTKRGGITCPSCLSTVKAYKAMKI